MGNDKQHCGTLQKLGSIAIGHATREPSVAQEVSGNILDIGEHRAAKASRGQLAGNSGLRNDGAETCTVGTALQMQQYPAATHGPGAGDIKNNFEKSAMSVLQWHGGGKSLRGQWLKI